MLQIAMVLRPESILVLVSDMLQSRAHKRKNLLETVVQSVPQLFLLSASVLASVWSPATKMQASAALRDHSIV